MASSLRDDLASLRIERRPAPRPERSRPGAGRGLSLLSALLWLIPLGLLAGASSVAYLQYEQIKPHAEVTVGLVQEMTTGEAETLLSAKGYIKSVYQAMIGAKMPGRVKEIGHDAHGQELKEGSRVTKGQVLAVLEHDDLIAQRDQRRAMLLRTEAELQKAQAELQEARDDLELKSKKAQIRTQLQSRGTVTGEELDQYVFDRKMAQSKIEALKAAISAQIAARAIQTAMITEIEAQIEDMKVKAPHDGTITEKNAEVGETILIGGMGGASGRGSVATIADLDHLEVETDIAENLLARIAPQQPAEVSVSAVPSQRYRGVLSRIIPMGDRTRGTVKVRVTILDPDELLFPELAATVHFLPKKDSDNPNAGKRFLFVPKAALVEEGGHQYVWVVSTRGTIERRLVEMAVTRDELARVEKGLQTGDRVVLSPPRSLRDGQPVNVAD